MARKKLKRRGKSSGKSNKFNALKLKMTTEKDLSKVYHYFFDHFGEDPEFVKKATRSEHYELQQVLDTILRESMGFTNIELMQHFLFVHLPKENFIHGSFPTDNPARLINYFYFDDINVGVMAVVPASPIADIETKFVRFGLQLPNTAGSSLN